MYGLLLRQLDFPCVALHSLMSQVKSVCCKAASVSLCVCLARAGSEVSLASQVQVRTSETPGCYRRGQQVRRTHAVIYAVYTSCAKLCGCWPVPRLSHTSIHRYASLRVRHHIHQNCIRTGDLSKSV